MNSNVWAAVKSRPQCGATISVTGPRSNRLIYVVFYLAFMSRPYNSVENCCVFTTDMHYNESRYSQKQVCSTNKHDHGLMHAARGQRQMVNNVPRIAELATSFQGLDLC